MNGPARPLRFVAVALIAWIGGRAALLSQAWNEEPAPPPMPPRAAPYGDFATVQAATAGTLALSPTAAAHSHLIEEPRAAPRQECSGPMDPEPEPAEAPVVNLPSPAFAIMLASGVSTSQPAPQPDQDAASPGPTRLTGYGWMFVRDSANAAGLANNGQLGGSQAGFRLDYALGRDPARGFQMSARISAPLEGKGREAAIGLGWKPGRDIPLTASFERRIALDRAGRNAFAASVAGGVNAIALPLDFRLDAYGQAGIVGARKRDKFIDGSISATRTIIAQDGISVAAGIGTWGAAQPRVERLDIGPRVRARIDIGRASIGIALDWRQRVAGNAAPSSGPALTLDGSF